MTISGFDDLKPSAYNRAPMTKERAFTICELIAYRVRDSFSGKNPAERAVATQIANVIQEIERAWR